MVVFTFSCERACPHPNTQNLQNPAKKQFFRENTEFSLSVWPLPTNGHLVSKTKHFLLKTDKANG